MSVPSDVAKALKEKASVFLDNSDYVSCDRPKATRLMEALAVDPEIGKVIEGYIGRDGVKTYIKDAILNRYMKGKRELPDDLDRRIGLLVSSAVVLQGKKGDVRIYRIGSDEGGLLIAGVGTLIKWETALRKLLEYESGFANELMAEKSMMRMLVLSSVGAVGTSCDRKVARESLSLIGVKACIW